MSSARIETAFLARVAGCILGKPFEFDPTLDELRAVLEPAGEWPLRDYVTLATNGLLRAPQPQWPELVREQITHVAEDDDINYTVIAMLLLEKHGTAFTASTTCAASGCCSCRCWPPSVRSGPSCSPPACRHCWAGSRPPTRTCSTRSTSTAVR